MLINHDKETPIIVINGMRLWDDEEVVSVILPNDYWEFRFKDGRKMLTDGKVLLEIVPKTKTKEENKTRNSQNKRV